MKKLNIMKSLNKLLKVNLLLIFCCLTGILFGQRSIDAIGVPITENFNTLTTSYNYLPWFDNSTLIGWYAKTDATSSIAEYTADDGTYPVEGLYSYGTDQSTDRAFGFFPSDFFTGVNGVAKGYLGWRLKNNTGKSIGSIRVVWTGEQWRKAVDANAQYITLSYQIGTSVTNLTGGTYISTNSTFASPIHTSTAAIALDGNNPTNRTSNITFDVNIVMPAGSEIMLRWEDLNDVANHTLAIDDVSFTATKESQTITFNTLTDKTYGDANFDLTATASSGLPVSYVSSNTSVAVIDGSTVTLTGAGITTITAKQSGDETYAKADSIDRVLNVKPQPPVSIDATNITVASFQANWNTANGAEGYYLFYGTDPTLEVYTGASVGLNTTFNLTGLLPNTTYYYRTKSINTGIYSDYSNIISVTTSEGIQTYNIAAIPAFTTADINWTNGNLSSRAVFMKEGSGAITLPTAGRFTASTNWDSKGTQLGTSGYYCIYYGTGTSLSLTNLYPGKLYTIQAFEFTGTARQEVFLTTATGVNNPITFTTWNTTTWTNSNGVSSTEDFATIARWDHAVVPTSALHPAVKVFIDGNCDISTDATANNLTIKAPHDGVIPKLSVSGGVSLIVVDSIVNDGDASALLIKSNSTMPNGSLVFNNSPSLPVSATVEMYSKAFKDVSYRWQFFGVPVQSLNKYPTFVDGVNYARKYNEAGTGSGLTTDKHWIQLQDDAILTPFAGYEVTQMSAQTYSFSGNLVNADYASGQLPYTPTAQYPGQHLIGNPYTAAINIANLEFGTSNAGIMENSVYLYNTGSYADWTNAGSGTASGVESAIPGLWVVIPKSAAGTNGLPSQIPSMQAFLVKVLQNDPSATLSIPYSSVGTVTKNTTMQRVAPIEKISTRIDVQGSNYADKLWLISEESCSHGFDNGWDGYKSFGTTSAPQIYAAEPAGDFQVSTVDDFNNTSIGFVAGSDNEYTMTFSHENLSLKYPALYLVDLQEGRTVDISENGSQYTFSASNTEPEARFKIVTSPDVATDVNNVSSGLKMYNVGKKIVVDNQTNYDGVVGIYNVSGQLILRHLFDANNRLNFVADLTEGVYIIKAETVTGKIASRMIIK